MLWLFESVIKWSTKASNMGSILHMVCIVVVLCRFSWQAQDTGYPAGLMAECPGMNRTTSLSERTKRSLSVVVVHPSGGFLGYREKRCKLVDDGEACVGELLDFSRRTVVLISGYLDATFSPIARSFISQYLAEGDNIIVLELFPVLVRTYPMAARITRPLGVLLGEFLAYLSFQGLSASQLYIVGASLGAHIASYTAVTFRERTGQKPARVTGLDPAGPCFRSMPPTERLHAAVAHRVDVLHTNIDGFGIAEPLGHVDFYANGGEFQPYLKDDFIMPCFQLCSHVRAALYWLLAHTHPDKFVAIRCDSVANARHGRCYKDRRQRNVLGPNTDFNRTGIFYLPTTAVPPFYLGKKGLKKRRYDVNSYLLTPAPDKDVTL